MDLKFSTRRFLGSLITNPSSQFRNSKWRNQYDKRECKKLLDWGDIWYSGVFEIGDYESELKMQKLKVAIWFLNVFKSHKKHINVAQLCSDISKRADVQISGGTPRNKICSIFEIAVWVTAILNANKCSPVALKDIFIKS